MRRNGSASKCRCSAFLIFSVGVHHRATRKVSAATDARKPRLEMPVGENS